MKSIFFCILWIFVFFCNNVKSNRLTLEEKISNLQDIIMKKPVINLNNDRWNTYVQSKPRNYTMVVMFTVLSSKMNCVICKPVFEEFQILANSYRYAYLHSKMLYFAMVDYEETPQAFHQLNLNTAPTIYIFSPKSTYRDGQVMNFQRMGIDAEAMARFIHDRVGITIRVIRPPSYGAPIVVLLLIMLVLGLLYMRRNNLDFLWNRTFWGIVSQCIVLAFLSGQMWNHIRGPPFVLTNSQTRQMSFVHGSTQYQLIAETYIVLILYACVSIGFLILNDAVNGKTDSNKRRLLVCVGLGFVVIFFSLLLSIFRNKYQGYPYHLLFS